MSAYLWLCDYLAKKPGATSDFKAEWEWTRYMIDGKMFAAICKDGAGDDVVTLKLEPTEGELLRAAFPSVKPGYYMDKRHWNSVKLDGALPDALLRDICDKSHALILAKLSKRRQAEIFGANPPNPHI